MTESAAALPAIGDLGERARAARSASAKALTTRLAEVLQEVPLPARPVLHRCGRSSSRRRLRPVEAQPADRRSLGRRLLGRPEAEDYSADQEASAE